MIMLFFAILNQYNIYPYKRKDSPFFSLTNFMSCGIIACVSHLCTKTAKPDTIILIM